MLLTRFRAIYCPRQKVGRLRVEHAGQQLRDGDSGDALNGRRAMQRQAPALPVADVALRHAQQVRELGDAPGAFDGGF